MDLWETCKQLESELNRISYPALKKAAEEAGLADGEWRGWLLPAYLLVPNGVSVSVLRLRTPYASATLYNNRLLKFAARGYLNETDNQFTLTSRGYDTACRMVAASSAALDGISIEDVELAPRIVSTLAELTRACLDQPDPHSKWCIQHNHGPLDLELMSPINLVDLYLSDLSAWRDDCHLGAWQPYHYIHGHVWELFTLIWQNGPQTLDQICAQLSERRGISRETYLNAAGELKIRGWIAEKDGCFILTPAGQKTRLAAENFTDELFLQPFAILDPTKRESLLADLKTLLAVVRAWPAA
jgi:hypothetical protein